MISVTKQIMGINSQKDFKGTKNFEKERKHLIKKRQTKQKCLDDLTSQGITQTLDNSELKINSLFANLGEFHN